MLTAIVAHSAHTHTRTVERASTCTVTMTLVTVVPRYRCPPLLVTVIILLTCHRITDEGHRRDTYVSVVMALLRQPPPFPSRRTNVIVHHSNSRDRFQRGGCTVFSTVTSRQRKTQYSTIPLTGSTNLYMVHPYLSLIDQFVQSSPYTTAAITCGIKASSADFIAQKRQLRKRNETKNNSKNTNDELPKDNDQGSTLLTSTTATSSCTTTKVKTDVSRNIAFLLYGALYQGIGQEYIYNHLYPGLFGTGTNPVTVLTKVAFDLLIQTTILTLPVAYGIKAMIYQYSFQEAFRRYIDDIRYHGLLTKYFTLWGPVQCLTFSIIPERYRISFIAIVSFFWLIVLSTISSRVRSAVGTVNSSKNNDVTTTATMPTKNSTDTKSTGSTKIILPSVLRPECELVDGLTCNIDG